MMLVRLAGIEPTTPWFVAKYSIQLSYSRERAHYISDCSKGYPCIAETSDARQNRYFWQILRENIVKL